MKRATLKFPNCRAIKCNAILQQLWSPVAFRQAMTPDVDRFITVEMIRDGGSFATKFGDRQGNQYILFTKIRFADVGPKKEDQHGYSQEREIVGYEAPVIIDCDPAKRPADTKTRIYSELSSPASRISWDQARKIIGKIGELAQGLNPIQAGWLKEMTAVVEAEGHPPPGKTHSIWHGVSKP